MYRLKSAMEEIPSNLQIQSHKANGSILDMKAEKYGSELIMKINLSPHPAPILKSRPKISTNNGVEKLDHLHSQIVIFGKVDYGLWLIPVNAYVYI